MSEKSLLIGLEYKNPLSPSAGLRLSKRDSGFLLNRTEDGWINQNDVEFIHSKQGSRGRRSHNNKTDRAEEQDRIYIFDLSSLIKEETLVQEEKRRRE